MRELGSDCCLPRAFPYFNNSSSIYRHANGKHIASLFHFITQIIWRSMIWKFILSIYSPVEKKIVLADWLAGKKN